MMWKLETSSAHTLNGLSSEVGDTLCPAVKFVKWKIFAYSYILEFLMMEEGADVIWMIGFFVGKKTDQII